MSGIERQMLLCLEVFAAEVAELAQQQAVEIISVALGRRLSVAKRRSRQRASRYGIVGRRSPEEIDRASCAILEEIGTNPGLRMEQLARVLGAPTKDLVLPIRKLQSRGVICSKGQRRATRYYPAAGASLSWSKQSQPLLPALSIDE